MRQYSLILQSFSHLRSSQKPNPIHELNLDLSNRRIQQLPQRAAAGLVPQLRVRDWRLVSVVP